MEDKISFSSLNVERVTELICFRSYNVDEMPQPSVKKFSSLHLIELDVIVAIMHLRMFLMLINSRIYLCEGCSDHGYT